MTGKIDLFLEYQSEFDDKKQLSDLLEYEIRMYFYASSYGKKTLLRSVIRTYLNLAAFCNKFRKFNNLVISSAYYNYNDHIRKCGYDIMAPPGIYKHNANSFNSFSIANKVFSMESLISQNNLYELLKYENNMLFELEDELEQFFKRNHIRAIILPSDLGVFNRLIINASKKNNVPSFIFQHGAIPQIYNLVDFNRTDYLVVWGSKVKDAYIKMGWKEDKVFVSGHPVYRKVPDNLRFSLDNVLVLTKSASGSDLQDKKNSIIYLLMIKRVLISLGIKRVRLRPHPYENPKWYMDLLGEDFFVLDQRILSESLNASSLVIGPSSTTLVDSIAHGINYHVFEPIDQFGKTLMNLLKLPPLDGLDDRIPISRNVEELKRNLKDKNSLHLSIFNELSDTKLDLNFFKEIVDSSR